MIRFQNLTTTFTYDAVDLPLIQQFNNQNPHVWDCKLSGLGLPRGAYTRRTEIKEYMKTRLYTIQGEYCIYCGNKFRSINSAHREHILPKDDYPEYCFHPKNLVLACDVCNGLEVKKNIDFALNKIQTRANYDDLDLKIIHPYLDDFFQHINNSKVTLKVISGSFKGKKKALRHIKTFKLNEGWNYEQRLRITKASKISIPLPFQNLFQAIINPYKKYKSR